MDLVPFEPFSLLRDIDRMLESGAGRQSTWAPRLDVFSREKELVIRMEIPGVSADDIDVTIEDRTLTISGTRKFDETVPEGEFLRREIFTGSFKRTLVLPEELNRNEISARTENGILEVAIPRRPEVLPRKVKVDVTS
jgi:HSP20 family protein